MAVPLDIQQARRPSPEPAGNFSPASGGRRTTPPVLVVDDEWLVRWALTQLLADAGFDVMPALGGTEALAYLRLGGQADIVVIDPVLASGTELDLTLLENLRALAPHAPIVVMTAGASPEGERAVCRVGADGMVDKPFNMKQMLTRIQELWRQSLTSGRVAVTLDEINQPQGGHT
jgi:DNA-binding response OmpR family regulator